jgi:hypothetical protein
MKERESARFKVCFAVLIREVKRDCEFVSSCFKGMNLSESEKRVLFEGGILCTVEDVVEGLRIETQDDWNLKPILYAKSSLQLDQILLTAIPGINEYSKLKILLAKITT